MQDMLGHAYDFCHPPYEQRRSWGVQYCLVRGCAVALVSRPIIGAYGAYCKPIWGCQGA